jgi:hypothetical protein
MRTDVLRTLATNFGSNSALAAKAIREMYVMDPVGFPPAVAELLGSGSDLPGTSYMMAMLLAEPDWLRTVCNPDIYTMEQSIELVRRAHKLDPSTELKLAKMLAPLQFTTDAEGRFASRVLEVLGRSPDPSTALPALRQLVQCQNPNVRSKAALLIGRINQNPQWANQGDTEPDWRVSANAVESLWGLATPAAREAFFKAALHENHRISVNGIVGLYRMGDECAIPFLFHLSESDAALCRAAAAWGMGHLEDPRFVPRLTRLMSDPEEMTRKGAFRALARVRQRMIQLRAAGAVQVQLRDVECRGKAHLVRLMVTQGEQFVKELDTRQFVVWNGPDIAEELSCSLHAGAARYYEIAFQGPPSFTHLVKVQVYAQVGVGEDTGFEMAFDS